ncbi:hypothetical protein SUDANB60_03311 [Streptomyces sp. enrichment culture]|uniref:GNAT family N-acetyltransferase n=1 Tax=Streptomyces sp. enrichment culture TaxID=1795815 RepID=UPI003F57A2F4
MLALHGELNADDPLLPPAPAAAVRAAMPAQQGPDGPGCRHRRGRGRTADRIGVPNPTRGGRGILSVDAAVLAEASRQPGAGRRPADAVVRPGEAAGLRGPADGAYVGTARGACGFATRAAGFRRCLARPW